MTNERMGWTQVHVDSGELWRDCNQHGVKHRWRLSHSMPDGVTYWLCGRGSCSVGTRTDSPWDRPRGYL